MVRSLDRVPKRFLDILDGDIDMKRGLPLNFVKQSEGKRTIFELPGYPHYLMRTEQGDILAIVADTKDGKKQITELGKGALGKVFLGKLLFSSNQPQLVGSFLAIKEQKLPDLENTSTIMTIRNERNTLSQNQELFLPYLVTDNRDIAIKYIFQELYSGDTLQRLQKEAISVADKVSISEKTLVELDKLHAKGILHLDIHDRNIMLRKERLADGHSDYHVNLIDFGTNKVIASPEEFVELNGWMQSAPAEVQLNLVASTKTDVYTMGIILARLFSQEFNLILRQRGDFLPIGVDYDVKTTVGCLGEVIKDQRAIWLANSGIRADYTGEQRVLLQEMKDIICKMLAPNYNDRPTAKVAVEQVRGLIKKLAEAKEPQRLPETNLQEFCKAFHFNIKDLNEPNKYGNNTLNVACEKGYIEIARQLLDKKVKFINSGLSANTALHYATKNGDWLLVKLLLEHNADPNVQNVQQRSSVMLSEKLPESKGDSKHRIEEMFRLYQFIHMYGFDFGDLNKPNLVGHTPLTFLMSMQPSPGNIVELSELLIKYGACVNQKDNFGKDALYYTLSHPDTKVLEQLISCGARIDNLLQTEKQTLTKFPKHKQALTIYSSLETHMISGIDPDDCNEKGNTALTYYASLNDLRMIQEFLNFYQQKDQAKSIQEILDTTNRYGNTPLHMAVENNNLDTIKFLLEQQVSIYKKNKFGITVFELAQVSKCQPEVKQLVLNHMQNLIDKIDEFGGTNEFLTDAYNKKDFNSIFALSKLRVDVLDNCDKFLEYIFYKRDLTVKDLQILSEMRFDIVGFMARKNIRHLSKDVNEFISLIKFLKENDFSLSLDFIDRSNISAHTPLTKAIDLKDINMFRLLIKHGANINQPNELGNTPLHLAADKDNLQLVEICLSCEGNINYINDNGQSAYDLAVNKGLHEIVERFKQYQRYDRQLEGMKPESIREKSMIDVEGHHCRKNVMFSSRKLKTLPYHTISSYVSTARNKKHRMIMIFS